jgi:hypothetical protein
MPEGEDGNRALLLLLLSNVAGQRILLLGERHFPRWGEIEEEPRFEFSSGLPASPPKLPNVWTS